MKILYSQLKQLAPGLKATPKQIGEKFTMAGLMIDESRRVKFNDKNDWLLGFEVRQNRADCLSVLGLAREVAGYYGLACKPPIPASNAFFTAVKNALRGYDGSEFRAKRGVSEAGSYFRTKREIKVLPSVSEAGSYFETT